MSEVKLSDRVSVLLGAAPWVFTAIQKLERDYDALEAENARLRAELDAIEAQQPVAYRECRVIGFRPGMGEVTFYVDGGVPAWMNIGETIYVADASPIAQTAPQSAPAGEHEAFEAIYGVIKPEYTADAEDLAVYAGEWRAFQSGAAWQRTQSAGVPEDLRAAMLAVIDRSDWRTAANRAELRALLAAAPAHPAAQDQGEVQRQPGRWVPFSERWPEPNAALDDPAVKSMPRVLVTNNFESRDRMGRMSHVWYGAPMKSNDGQVITFTESDSRIYGLTHWFEIDLLAASTGQEVEK